MRYILFAIMSFAAAAPAPQYGYYGPPPPYYGGVIVAPQPHVIVERPRPEIIYERPRPGLLGGVVDGLVGGLVGGLGLKNVVDDDGQDDDLAKVQQ